MNYIKILSSTILVVLSTPSFAETPKQEIKVAALLNESHQKQIQNIFEYTCDLHDTAFAGMSVISIQTTKLNNKKVDYIKLEDQKGNHALVMVTLSNITKMEKQDVGIVNFGNWELVEAHSTSTLKQNARGRVTSYVPTKRNKQYLVFGNSKLN